jgi:Ca-activated chloride channel family protein
LAFRRGWLLVLLLAIGLLPSAPTYAWEWRDLWERKDQQGNKAFAQEDFTTAAETFRDPQWRAAANYRSENFEGVIQDLALIDTPEAHYNRGNALAKLGMFPQAIEAYERTLAFTPGHADALQNKELVEKLLEEQEKEQQQNNEGDQQQQENDQQQQEQQEQQDQQQQNQQNQNQNQNQQQQDQQQQDQEQQRQDENQKKEEQESEEQDQERKDEQEQQEQQQSADNQKPETEEEQAMQQWLMRIPDDPGELLRNKFRYQTQQRVFEQLQNPDQSQREASEKIW